ncbi:MAG: TRAP transporter fused permease subunit, partial [Burkholderiales bacterium]|nr:TRAP transporter fused permease subunit [Burkholderiales bacterium]
MSESGASAQRLVEEEEGSAASLTGWSKYLVTALAIGTSLFHLYAAYEVVSAPVLRTVHVALILSLCFLTFPLVARLRGSITWLDRALVVASVSVAAYLIMGGDALYDRATSPTKSDLAIGVVAIGLVLEAVRRASGWIMPVVVGTFLAYAIFGAYFPAPWAHRGYDMGRIVGHMVITLEGIYGSAVDVSSTLIILFTIFGAFLATSGAGRFFIDFSIAAMGRSRNAAARSVVLSSFLLGGASGSGVATTVTIGSVAYPMLSKAGYQKDAAGGLLSAGGLGAILCPPIMGAAAFLIAEFLKISYLEVLRMAILPACLYYLSLFYMVGIDGRRFGASTATVEATGSVWYHLGQHGYYFLPLVAIVAMLLKGFSPIMAVFWAILVAYAVSFVRRDSRLNLPRLGQALASGSTGVVNVAVTCAAAGIIVGVVTLTGLGLKFSSIVVGYAGGSLFLTALFTALVVWVVGLAVPVTASYIICAVIAAPALIEVGVPNYAAHMFIFYYAVLSEVSPPTALSPFAAAAITGGNPYRTTLQSWKYTLPAFVVP